MSGRCVDLYKDRKVSQQPCWFHCLHPTSPKQGLVLLTKPNISGLKLSRVLHNTIQRNLQFSFVTLGETSKFPPSNNKPFTKCYRRGSVGDICRRFTKLTGPCAYTLHSDPIPPTDGTNGLQKQVTDISQHIFVIYLWGF